VLLPAAVCCCCVLLTLPLHAVASGPKLYLYAWCGVSQEQLDPAMMPADNNDFVATIDVSCNALLPQQC
jgi:hypothetical protein